MKNYWLSPLDLVISQVDSRRFIFWCGRKKFELDELARECFFPPLFLTLDYWREIWCIIVFFCKTQEYWGIFWGILAGGGYGYWGVNRRMWVQKDFALLDPSARAANANCKLFFPLHSLLSNLSLPKLYLIPPFGLTPKYCDIRMADMLFFQECFSFFLTLFSRSWWKKYSYCTRAID